MEITIEDEGFVRALQQYTDLTSENTVDAINKKAKDLCFEAAKQMPVGKPYKDNPKGSKIYHVLAAGGNRAKNGQSLETRFGKHPKGKGNKKMANKIAVSRNTASNYSKAICLKMASDIGGYLKRRIIKKSGTIKHARGKRATKGMKIKATLDVEGLEKSHVDEVIQPAFNRAAKATTKDIQKYIDRKMKEAAKKHSGKRRV